MVDYDDIKDMVDEGSDDATPDQSAACTPCGSVGCTGETVTESDATEDSGDDGVTDDSGDADVTDDTDDNGDTQSSNIGDSSTDNTADQT